jgi:hypothetical protein
MPSVDFSNARLVDIKTDDFELSCKGDTERQADIAQPNNSNLHWFGFLRRIGASRTMAVIACQQQLVAS